MTGNRLSCRRGILKLALDDPSSANVRFAVKLAGAGVDKSPNGARAKRTREMSTRRTHVASARPAIAAHARPRPGRVRHRWRWAGTVLLLVGAVVLPAGCRPGPGGGRHAHVGYGAWEPLGGAVTGAPAVTAWGPGHLDVFVEGPGQALWHKWYGGNWSAWENLGGPPGGLGSAPAAVAWSAGRIDVVVRGVDSHALAPVVCRRMVGLGGSRRGTVGSSGDRLLGSRTAGRVRRGYRPGHVPQVVRRRMVQVGTPRRRPHRRRRPRCPGDSDESTSRSGQ